MSRVAEWQEQRQQLGGGGGNTAASTEAAAAAAAAAEPDAAAGGVERPTLPTAHTAKTAGKPDEEFRCDDCDQAYASKGSLKTHLASKKHAGKVGRPWVPPAKKPKPKHKQMAKEGTKEQPVRPEDALTARVVRLAAVGDAVAVRAEIKHRQVDLNRPIPRPPSPVTPQLSPLMAAAAGNHLEVAGVLLDGGADPNQDEAGWTAAMWAAQRGHREMVELLADRGAQLARLSAPTIHDGHMSQSPRRDDFPVLVCAAQGGHLKLVRALLERTGYEVLTAEEWGGDNTFGRIYGRSAIHHAIVNGDIAMVRLLRRYGADDDAKTWDHWEPSHRFAMTCHDMMSGPLGAAATADQAAATADRVMNEDLSYDEYDNSYDGDDDDTIGGPHYKSHRGNRRSPRRRLAPLELAAALGKVEILKFFCEETAALEVRELGPFVWGKPRKSPMVLAVMGGHLHVVKYLLDHGYETVLGVDGSWQFENDDHMHDNDAATPLMLAAYRGDLMIVRALLEAGAAVMHQVCF